MSAYKEAIHHPPKAHLQMQCVVLFSQALLGLEFN